MRAHHPQLGPLAAGAQWRAVHGVELAQGLVAGNVEREFGRPARMERVASWRGEVMTYRWNDGSDMFFWVYLDSRQVVQRTQQGMEFVNAPDRE